MQLTDRKILLCVSGGIAAYKAIDLVSRLTKQGASVRTIMTEGALKFVSPINFAALSGEAVHTSLFEDSDPIPHINLADWADLMIIAPATANVLAKAAHGISDDLLSATLLAHNKPVLFVPAMNVHMYENAATQDNIKILKARGHHVLEPDSGMLACGYEGKGKYPPNEEIVFAIETYLEHVQDCKGLKVLVTAGACEEAIDPMRFITNRSSGKMGLAIARAFALRGAEVDLLFAGIDQAVPYNLHSASKHLSADSMHKAVSEKYHMQDVIVMCAAVSDYTPDNVRQKKIKKGGKLNLELVPTVDILEELGRKVDKPRQKLIGFAAETEDLLKNARKKLEKKNLDLIVVNHIRVAGMDDTVVDFVTRQEAVHAEGTKLNIANMLVDIVKAL